MGERERRRKVVAVHARKLSHITSEAEYAMQIEHSQSAEDVQVITQALMKHFIFTSLTEENLDEIIRQMRMYELDE
jgi:hypothetical protein